MSETNQHWLSTPDFDAGPLVAKMEEMWRACREYSGVRPTMIVMGRRCAKSLGITHWPCRVTVQRRGKKFNYERLEAIP